MHPEGGGSSGESAAESSVTTSSSKKSAIIPDTVEANPIANVIRAGLPLSDVKALVATGSAETFRTITTTGSSTDLQNLASSVKSGLSDFATISEVIVTNIAAGKTINSATALNRSEGVKNNRGYLRFSSRYSKKCINCQFKRCIPNH